MTVMLRSFIDPPNIRFSYAGADLDFSRFSLEYGSYNNPEECRIHVLEFMQKYAF